MAQAPKAFTCQTVVRAEEGRILANQAMSARLSLVKTGNSQVVYMERHSVMSNANGLITLLIGRGQPIANSPAFNSIPWEESLFVRVEIDPDGGTSYSISIEQPLASVPYAIFANETQEGAFSGNYNDLTNRPDIPEIPTNVSAFVNDPPYITDYQILPQVVNRVHDSLAPRTQILHDNTLNHEELLDSIAAAVDSITTGGFICGLHKVIDFDGNLYNTVQLDKQCWMRENLRVRHYSDGREIPWGGGTVYEDPTPRCYPHFWNNDPGFTIENAGLHYNWAAVLDGGSGSNSIPSGVQGVCPVGWHVPSFAEWQKMLAFVKSQLEYHCNSNPASIAKALSSQTCWNPSSSECTPGFNGSDNNQTLLSLVPTGCTSLSVTNYVSNHIRHQVAQYWSSWGRRYIHLNYNSASVTDNAEWAYNALPVRCVRDELSYNEVQRRLATVTTVRASNVSDHSFRAGCNVVTDGNSLVTEKGICWSTLPNPTINDFHVAAGAGETGVFTVTATGLNMHTIYYYRAYATNAVGTSYGEEYTVSTTWIQMDSLVCPDIPAVADIDGNVYSTVKIGEQCWMRENLRTTHFPNGSPIPMCTDWSQRSDSLPFCYPPAKDTSKVAVYGLLYNWHAAMNGEASSDATPSGVQGICPNGWHIPSRAEQYQLKNYVSALNKYRCTTPPDQVWHVAPALASNFGWASCSAGCTPGYDSTQNNATGLSICPAGSIIGNVSYSFIGGFEGFGTFGGIMCSTLQYNDHYDRYYTYAIAVRHNNDYISGASLFYRKDAISVRCVQDYDAPPSTACQFPTVVTGEVTNVTSTSAMAKGRVTNTGGCAVTERGICWNSIPHPTIDDNICISGADTGTYSCPMTDLSPETDYYVRAYAVNEQGVVYGEEQRFVTSDSVPPGPALPSVTTYPASDIALNSAVSGGLVMSDGGALVTERGLCWGFHPNPTVEDYHIALGTGTGTFTHTISDLYLSMTYYVRAYAVNSAGIAYGNEIAFQTLTPAPQRYDQVCPGTSVVTDHDGNIYNTVRIGNQCWMRENLRTTHYEDGTEIPLATAFSTTPVCYSPDGSSNNVASYGYLYNWAAVMNGAQASSSIPSGVQGICPSGWHVPSLEEYQLLYGFLQTQSECLCNGVMSNVALSLVDHPSSYWAIPNDWMHLVFDNCSPVGGWVTSFPNIHNMINATGFSARAAGYYGSAENQPGWFNFTANAMFWTSSKLAGEPNPKVIFLDFRFPNLNESNIYTQEHGFSVRCVHDLPVECAPTVYTTTVSDITAVSARGSGNITHNGGVPVTAYGLVWSTSPDPTLADNSAVPAMPFNVFTVDMANLQPNTFYYVRAYAITANDTVYGNEVKFFTADLNYSTDGQPCPDNAYVYDYDGNQYATIQMGEQCWMKENLRTTHFYDGTEIPLGDSLSTTLPCRYYPNMDMQFSYYGYLYNWKAVCAMNDTMTASVPSGIQGICPFGWHVPSNGEWQQLHDYLSAQTAYNCDTVPGNYGKAVAATSLWKFSDGECFVGDHPMTNNTSGFGIHPLGMQTPATGIYAGYFGGMARFWTITRQSSLYLKAWGLDSNQSSMTTALQHRAGAAAVRCVKD